jgi:mono/diheme cytochrome c family protein
MFAKLAAALLLATAVSACGATTPPQVRYGGRVVSGEVVRGEQRYRVICGPCHIDHNDRRAPMLDSVHLTPWEIRRQVREGDEAMTAIPMRRLSDEELEAVLAYFVTTGTCIGAAQDGSVPSSVAYARGAP